MRWDRKEVFEFDVFWQKVGGHVITIQILYFAKFRLRNRVFYVEVDDVNDI